ncbi:MAG: dUTP diphosphatase [Spirochaetia bacterium]
MNQNLVIKYTGNVAPYYASKEASGADICAQLNSPITMMPQESALIPTGLAIEIPFGYEAQVRPRSGLALKHGITVLNSPGTIDSDYRGEIKIILINLGPKKFTIENGERIAQLVIAPVVRAEFQPVTILNSSDRQHAGFGSTGKK